jgi:hypothetical protein
MCDTIQSNNHTMVHTNPFVVDLIYIQSIKQRTVNLLSMGCMRCLYICLYAQFEILKTATCLRACTTVDCKPSASRYFCGNTLTSARRRACRHLAKGRRGLVLPDYIASFSTVVPSVDVEVRSRAALDIKGLFASLGFNPAGIINV